MFGEMRTAALLAKARGRRRRGLRRGHERCARQRLGGARAMGLDDRIGSIEPGKQADLTCVDLSALETQPMYHVISQLVYATGRHQVSDVWIARRAQARRQRVLVDMDVPRASAPRRASGANASPASRCPHDRIRANVSQAELDKFDALASRWWDPDGPQRPLHELNPARLGYVARAPAAGAMRARARCRLRRRPAERGAGARRREGHRARPRARTDRGRHACICSSPA